MNNKECLEKIGPFLERLIKPRYDEFETNDYICNSTDCKNALEAYQQCRLEYEMVEVWCDWDFCCFNEDSKCTKKEIHLDTIECRNLKEEVLICRQFKNMDEK